MSAAPGSCRGTPRLSVAIIVRNAPLLLAQTVSSVRAIADEIVVADTGSTDRTRRVAVQHATRVIDAEWQDDFSAARNACLAECRGDWVLWLDAGETLTVRDAAAMRCFLDREADPKRAYQLLVRVPSTTSDGSCEQIGRLRLVPWFEGLRFSGRVREDITDSLDARGIEVDRAPWLIHRGQQEHDSGVQRQRALRDLKLAELEIVEHGPRPDALLVKAVALNRLTRYEEALAVFEHARALSPRGSDLMLEAYYGELTARGHLVDESKVPQARCEQALTVFPLDAQLLCALGSHQERQGDLDSAQATYQLAAERGGVNRSVCHLSDILDLAVDGIRRVLCEQGRTTEAQRVVEEGLERWPESIRLRRRLIQWHIHGRQREEANAQVDLLPEGVPHREALRSAVRGACLTTEKNWMAARGYLQTAFNNGCRDPLYFRAMAETLAALSDRTALMHLVDDWQRFEPASAEIGEYTRRAERMSADGLNQAASADVLCQSMASEGRRWRIDAPQPAMADAAGRGQMKARDDLTTGPVTPIAVVPPAPAVTASDGRNSASALDEH